MFICLNSQTLKSCALIHSERTTRYTVLPMLATNATVECASAFFHNFHWCNTMSSLTCTYRKKAKINEWKLSKLYAVEIYLQNQHSHLELRFVAVCWLRGSKHLRPEGVKAYAQEYYQNHVEPHHTSGDQLLHQSIISVSDVLELWIHFKIQPRLPWFIFFPWCWKRENRVVSRLTRSTEWMMGQIEL